MYSDGPRSRPADDNLRDGCQGQGLTGLDERRYKPLGRVLVQWFVGGEAGLEEGGRGRDRGSAGSEVEVGAAKQL
jgi:hypothetical protein